MYVCILGVTCNTFSNLSLLAYNISVYPLSLMPYNPICFAFKALVIWLTHWGIDFSSVHVRLEALKFDL